MRSPPQNSSPSKMKVGTPNTPAERIGARLGDERVGTHIVDPEADHARLLSRRHIHQKAKPTAASSSAPTRSSMADSWIHATAGTDTARNTPTAQMRQTPAWTPAT